MPAAFDVFGGESLLLPAIGEAVEFFFVAGGEGEFEVEAVAGFEFETFDARGDFGEDGVAEGGAGVGDGLGGPCAVGFCECGQAEEDGGGGGNEVAAHGGEDGHSCAGMQGVK